MSNFDFVEYQASLKAVQECIQEMDDAMDGLRFEHGAGGVSDRAISYIHQLNHALTSATKKQADITKLILKEMVRDES